MATTIAFVSQKGGVGKSSLARTLAVEVARVGLTVKLADLDIEQKTCVNWACRRMAAKLEPGVSVEPFGTAAQALRCAAQYDVVIVDGPARANQGTLELAKAVDLVVQPAKPSLDDLEPAVLVFNGLVKSGVSRAKLAFALSRCGGKPRTDQARDYLHQTGFAVLDGCLYEKDAYNSALDAGRVATETSYKHLNHEAAEIIRALIDLIGTNGDTNDGKRNAASTGNRRRSQAQTKGKGGIRGTASA
jgi:chromosome partitioning protein